MSAFIVTPFRLYFNVAEAFDEEESPELHFYSLYDRRYCMDTLRHAYRCCKANVSGPGVNTQTHLGNEFLQGNHSYSCPPGKRFRKSSKLISAIGNKNVRK